MNPDPELGYEFRSGYETALGDPNLPPTDPNPELDSEFGLGSGSFLRGSAFS